MREQILTERTVEPSGWRHTSGSSAVFAGIATWLVLVYGLPALAAERVALVVGNAGYAGAGKLANPVRDAATMSKALRELDFRVIEKTDLDLAGMEDALRDFYRELGEESLGLFFYAGHGLQVQGENYLVPIGAKIEEEYEVKRQCLAMSHVLDALDASSCRLKVVVLDSYRDNPFQRAWRTRSKSGQGLAAMSTVPEGTIIAFSTSPGKTAADGGGENSPYTTQLAEALQARPAEGLELRNLFFRASAKVKQRTGQIPWVNMDATIDEYFLWRGEATDVASKVEAMPKVELAKNEANRPEMLKPVEPPVELSRTVTNSIGMKLNLIPAGEFRMGSPESELGYNGKHQANESPQHQVQITKPYYLGIYEVTQEEYEQVMGTNQSWFSSTGGGKDKVRGLNTRRYPVELISWEDAQEFCRRLSTSEGREYRLPTEAEWEYACRGGTTTTYYTGSSELSLTEAGWFDGNSELRTHAVGQKKPNAFGLYDMHGNVWEWCSDWYGEDYYTTSPVDDPKGPAQGLFRVGRGGGCLYYAINCRSAARDRRDPSDRYNFLGFRVALDPSE